MSKIYMSIDISIRFLISWLIDRIHTVDDRDAIQIWGNSISLRLDLIVRERLVALRQKICYFALSSCGLLSLWKSKFRFSASP